MSKSDMGFNISIFIVHDLSPQQIWAALGLQPTGEQDVEPEAPVQGKLSGQGNYLLWFNDRQVFGPDAMLPLFHKAKFLELSVSETCMVFR